MYPGQVCPGKIVYLQKIGEDMVKKKMVICLFFILIFLCGCHAKKSKNALPKLESATTLEQERSQKTETKKWKKKLVDETGNKSQTELENIENEAKKVIDEYQNIAFNINKNTPDYTKKLLALYSTQSDNGSDKEKVKEIYNDFHKEKTISSYKRFSSYGMHMKEYEVPTVVLFGLTTIHLKSAILPEGDYDISTRFVLEKDGQDWKMVKCTWGNIYKSNSVKVYDNYNGSMITYEGEYVGMLQFD